MTRTKSEGSGRLDGRASARSRGYTRQWEKARAIFLRANPLCVYCLEMGQVKSASVVDHKKPHEGSAELFWDESNWQALCKQCHDATKQRLEARGVLVHHGADADGMPIDPHHHWNGNANGSQMGG